MVRTTFAFSELDLDWNLLSVSYYFDIKNRESCLRRSASRVLNAVHSSSFLRGSVLTPLSFSADTLRGSGGTTWVGLTGLWFCG